MKMKDPLAEYLEAVRGVVQRIAEQSIKNAPTRADADDIKTAALILSLECDAIPRDIRGEVEQIRT